MEVGATARPSLAITSCRGFPSSPLITDAQGLPPVMYAEPGDRLPLKIRPRSVILARISQSSPYPAGLNTLSLTLVTSFVLDGNTSSFIRLSNLTNATFQTGPIQLSNESFPGTAHHLLFAYESGARDQAGTGNWDDESKELTMYLIGTMAAATPYTLSFTIENPPAPQGPATVLVLAQGGVSASGVFTADTARNLAAEGVSSAKMGDAAPLLVIQSIYVSGTRARQSTPNPVAMNTITIAFGSSVSLRASTRAYDYLQVEIAELVGAAAATGPIALVASGSRNDTALFAATGGGAGGQGAWDDDNKVCTA